MKKSTVIILIASVGTFAIVSSFAVLLGMNVKHLYDLADRKNSDANMS